MDVSVVKRVLFGLQKQANVQNDVIVRIVSEVLSGHGLITEDSEDGVRKGIQKYLQQAVDNPEKYSDDLALALIAGDQSVANLNAPGPNVVYQEQVNPESPKTIFRINKLSAQARRSYPDAACTDWCVCRRACCNS